MWKRIGLGQKFINRAQLCPATADLETHSAVMLCEMLCTKKTRIRSRRPVSVQTESHIMQLTTRSFVNFYETICNSIFSTHTLIAKAPACALLAPFCTPTTQLVDHFTLFFCFSIFRETAASSLLHPFLKADLLLKRIVAVQCSLLIL